MGGGHGNSSNTFDVFLSHASEDKTRFVAGLHEALCARGLRVWYDAAEIELGDDFRQKMQSGLTQSQVGVVVLSPHFFKYWPEQEVSALFTLEAATKQKKILPVLLDLTWEALVDRNPFLGARLSVSASEGAQRVAARIARALEKEKKRKQALPDERMKTLLEKRAEMTLTGADTTSISGEILQLKRELRAGPSLVSGDFLSERYHLKSELGKGGFATVWKAYDSQRNKFVAIKVLHGQHARSADRVERFFRGSRYMERLQHDNIVRVLEVQAEDDGHAYFVMELLAGGDLKKAIEDGRLASDVLLGHIESMAGALAFAHKKDIIHRDVKPANILLTHDGTPKLTDFDLVRAGDTTGGTRTGALGTVIYAERPSC